MVTLTSVTEVYVIERQGGNTNKGNRSEGSQLTGHTGLAADGVVVSRRTETPATVALTVVLRTVIVSCTRSVQPVWRIWKTETACFINLEKGHASPCQCSFDELSTKVQSGSGAQTGMCQFSSPTIEYSCGCTVLCVLESLHFSINVQSFDGRLTYTA